jgi:rare lipoprotein A
MRRRFAPKKRARARRVAVAAMLVISTAAINEGQRMPAATAAALEQVAKPRAKKLSARRSQEGHAMSGVASRYADRFQGRRTANGERYDQRSYTAAHKTLPFGTYLKVTNKRNKRSVIVRINDRGPHVKGRVLDLSTVAARAIGFHHAGLTQVSAEIVEYPT